eukprot:EG_transcript_774
MERQPLRLECELMLDAASQTTLSRSPLLSFDVDAAGGGVTTAQAEAQLSDALRRLDAQVVERQGAWAVKALGEALAEPWTLLALAAGLASLAATIVHQQRGDDILAPGTQTGLILGILGFDVVFEARQRYLQHVEVVRRFRRQLRGLQLSAGLRGCCGTHGSTSYQGVYAWRDAKWTFIPKVLLVAGDAVLQEVACRVRRIHEDVLPARLRAFFSPSQLPTASTAHHHPLEAGPDRGADSSDDDTASNAAYTELARETHEDGRPPAAALHQEVYRLVTWVTVGSVALVLILNLIRFFTVSQRDGVFLFLTHPAYVAIAGLPMSLRLFLRIVSLVGNAQLLALLRWLYAPEPAASATTGPQHPHEMMDFSATLPSASPSSVPPAHAVPCEDLRSRPSCTRLTFTATVNLDNVGALRVPVSQMLRFVGRTLFHQRLEHCGVSGLLYAVNHLYSLGSTTVVCCVDKEGVLSEIVPTPEKVLVMKRRGTEAPAGTAAALDGGASAGAGIGVEAGDGGGSVLREDPDNPDNAQCFSPDVYHVLDLIVDRASDRCLRFGDTRWTDYAAVLKPIGLNCLVHALQSLDEEERVTAGHGPRVLPNATGPISYDQTVFWGKNLYALAREIGVTGESITCLKKRIHTLHVVEAPEPVAGVDQDQEPGPVPPPAVQQMVSLVAEDGLGHWQLLTIGSPEIVLDCCEEYWDGEECIRLTTQDRQLLLQQAGQWVKGHDLLTLALAYRPVPEEHQPALEAMDRCVYRAHCPPGPAPHGPGDGASDAASTDPAGGPPLEGEALLSALVADHIFLGFVGLRHQPQQHVPEFLELFRRAGIRFAYFSPTSEQKTKAFGDRLGLYTDWNCCISLRSRHVSLDATSLKARLPHGIGAIRSHLARVDNVPLLVSLFCDATPLSTARMIGILRTYNEVVCTVGSVLNHNNPHIFRSSHCAVSLLPAANEALLAGNKAYTRSPKAWFGALGCGTRDNGNWAGDARATGRLGALLATPCALTLPCVDYPFYALLCLILRARHLLHAVGRALQLLVFSNLFVHLLLVCSDLVFLPPVLTGVQTVWLALVVLPILASSVLHTHPGALLKSMADTIPAKHDAALRRRILWHLADSFAWRLLPSIPVLLFVFAASLKYTAGIPWIGVFVYATDFDDPALRTPLLVAQNVAAFFVVVWMLVHSLGYLSRHRHLYEFRPWRQYRWLVFATLALGLQVGSGALSLWLSGHPDQRCYAPDCFGLLGVEVYCVGFLWPVAIVLGDELTKTRRRWGYKLVQKR